MCVNNVGVGGFGIGSGKDFLKLSYLHVVLFLSGRWFCVLVLCTGLPRSGKNIRKMKIFPGRGKVREFCGWPGKFRKDLESQGKVGI